MKKKLLFVWFQMKMALQMIPRILLGTVGFAILIGLIALTGQMVLEAQDSNSSAADIALVNQDDNKYTKLALNFLFEEETIKETCNFIEMSEEMALTDLKKGSVVAVVVIPQGFLNSVLNGTNLPAQIVLSQGGTNSQSKYFREMVQSGANDLAIAQAAIYSIEEYCSAVGREDIIGEANTYMNETLLSFALRRGTYLSDEVVSVTGDFSVTVFYIASGIVLLLLLSGITCNEILKNENAAFVVCMKRQGIGRAMTAWVKLCSVVLVYALVFVAVYLVAGAMGKVVFSMTGILGIILLLFAAFAIGQFCFVLTNQRMSGALLLFAFTVVMMFLAGCFLPDAFLPQAVVRIGKWMPAKYMVTLCGQIISGQINHQIMLCVFESAVAFVAATSLIALIKPVRNR